MRASLIASVRPVVHLVGALSGTDTPERLTRLNALRKRLIQESADLPIPSTPPPARVGDIPKAIIKALEARAEPMHVSEIHSAIEGLLDRPVNPRSVKSCLSEGARRRQPTFRRTAYGCYRLS